MLTRAGRITLVIGTCTILAGRILGLLEVTLLGVTALTTVAVAAMWLRVQQAHVKVERTITPRSIPQGEMAQVRVMVANARSRRSTIATLTDPLYWHDHQGDLPMASLTVAPLRGNAQTESQYAVEGTRRGILTVGPMRITQTDPFGLVSTSRSGPPAAHIIVVPRFATVSPPSFGGGDESHGSELRGQRIATSGHEFASLRDYVRGDDLRRVHWATTARRDQLTVRNDDQPFQTRTTIVLDVAMAAHDNASFEAMVSAAASIAAACITRGDETRLLSTAGLDTLPGTGPGHFNVLLRELAVVMPTEASSMSETLAQLHMDRELGVVTLQSDRATPRTPDARTDLRSMIQVVFAGDAPDGQSATTRSALRGQITVGAEGFTEAWNRAMAQQPRRTRTLQ